MDAYTWQEEVYSYLFWECSICRSLPPRSSHTPQHVLHTQFTLFTGHKPHSGYFILNLPSLLVQKYRSRKTLGEEWAVRRFVCVCMCMLYLCPHTTTVIYIHTHTHTHTHIHTWMCVCTYMYIYVYTHVCIYIYTYLYM